MTIYEMASLFKSLQDEYMQFNRISPKDRHSNRRDLHAFIVLDKLIPSGVVPIVAGASHDEIYLNAMLEEVLPLLTPDIVRDLVRCGVRYDSKYEKFEMFV